MVALKMGTGVTMVVTEQAWYRARAEAKRYKDETILLRKARRRDDETITKLLSGLVDAYQRIDSQTERLVNLLAEREECLERVTAMSRRIAGRVA